MPFLSNPLRIFVGTDKLIPKLTCKAKVTRRAQMILKKKDKVGEITLLDFKTYVIVTITYAV